MESDWVTAIISALAIIAFIVYVWALYLASHFLACTFIGTGEWWMVFIIMLVINAFTMTNFKKVE